MTFLDELHAIGTLTDPHLDEYDGGTFATPSLIDHDDGKETNGEETQRTTIRAPRT